MYYDSIELIIEVLGLSGYPEVRYMESPDAAYDKYHKVYVVEYKGSEMFRVEYLVCSGYAVVSRSSWSWVETNTIWSHLRRDFVNGVALMLHDIRVSYELSMPGRAEELIAEIRPVEFMAEVDRYIEFKEKMSDLGKRCKEETDAIERKYIEEEKEYLHNHEVESLLREV